MKKILLSLVPLLLIGVLVAFSTLHRTQPAPAPAPAATAVELAAAAVPDPDFTDFLKQFPKASLPYSLSAEYLKEYYMAAIEIDESSGTAEQEARYNSRVRLHDPRHFLAGSRHSMFSRIPVFLEPVARLETPTHYAVVFSESQGFGWAYTDYHVAVFTRSGRLLSEHPVAGTGSAELTAVAIDARLHALVQTYRINWEKDYYENGTEGNSITGLTLDSAKTLDLTQADDKLRDYKPTDKDHKDATEDEESFGAIDR